MVGYFRLGMRYSMIRYRSQIEESQRKGKGNNHLLFHRLKKQMESVKLELRFKIRHVPYFTR